MQRLFALVVPVAVFASSCVLPPSDPGTALFPNGVAAGDVTASGATVWVRTTSPRHVKLNVYTDQELTGTPVLTTGATATTATDLTAKVSVSGLAPGTNYYYRWTSGTDVSRAGRFKTAPDVATAAPLRFVFAGDSDALPFAGPPAFNNFEVLDRAYLEQGDFFAYLGDTIYSDSGQEPTPATTLDEYRDIYEHNRLAPLERLMASTGTYAQPDDHEVHNDYAGQTVDPNRYANGWQAFHEWMPTDESRTLTDPSCAGDPRYLTQEWGSQVELFVLDQRSCRTDTEATEAICDGDLAPTAPTGLRVFAGLPAAPPDGCLEALFDPDASMLGSVQKQQFKDDLSSSTATWKVVLSELAWQQFWALPYDRWEGFAAERNELLNFIRDEGIGNVLFLTTDNHANIHNEVFIDFATDPDPIAYEAINGPIATNTLEQAIINVAGPELVAPFNAALSVLGVDCRALDAYSYGLVTVDESGTLTVRAKGADGKILTDDVTPSTKCETILTP